VTSDNYERVNFGQGPIDSDILNQLSANQDYLYEHMVTGYYNILGVTRETGLTFRVGHAKLLNQSDIFQVHNVYFDRPFLPGTRPAVFLTLSMDQHWYLFYAVQGLDGRAIPDHRGFRLVVGKSKDWQHEQFDREQYISYLAIAPTG
jgi:hypothetical protein